MGIRFLTCDCGGDEFSRVFALIIDDNDKSQVKARMQERKLICVKCRKQLKVDKVIKKLNVP